LEKVKQISKMANFVYVRQKKHFPYGNGTPLLAVKNLINKNERFVYMFGDDLVLADDPCAKQLMDFSDSKGGAVVVAVQEIPESEVNRYGIYKISPDENDRVIDAVEKPDPGDVTPPYLAQFGRFVLNYDIIKILERKYEEKALGKDNELWLIDAIVEYAKDHPVYAAHVNGEWMTTGDPLRYMKTQVRYALKREDIGPEFAEFLKEVNLER